MNRRNIFAVAATVVGLAVIPVTAQKAQDSATGEHAKHGRHGRFLGRSAAALNLSDAQKATAKQLFADARQQSEPLMQQLKQVRTDLEAAVKANNTAQISTLTARQGQISGQLAEIRTKAMASFYAQLTPEQKAKADELHGKMREGRGRHFGGSRHQRGA